MCGKHCRGSFIVIATGFVALIAFNAFAEQRPFRATVAGNAHLTPTGDPCIIQNVETGEGEATHLGHYVWDSTEVANFCVVPGGVAVTGTFTMTAANGDHLNGAYTTTGFFDASNNLIFHGTVVFAGGDGRFANATGGGTIDAIGYFTPDLPVVGFMDATIDY